MNFNKHLDLVGQHAFLGASKYSWLNYDKDKLIQSFINAQAAEKGTELHELASKLIKFGIPQKATKSTFNMYVNDAISFRLNPEQVLFYSRNCFGTADAISYNEKKKFLRIHDLKTGVTIPHMEQLEIYAALFCLEYHVNPLDISIELRIYHNNDIIVHSPTGEKIKEIMQKIVYFDGLIEQLRVEE